MATNNAINTPLITLANTFTMAGNFPFVGNLTGSTNVTFPTSGTLATTLQGITWADVPGTTQAAAVNTGYIISNAALTTVTLPATAAEGSVIAVSGKGVAGWILQANTGQTIKFGSQTTSTAGTLSSTLQYDTISVLCVTANTTWVVQSAIGNITYA